jgi:hypothetical protein
LRGSRPVPAICPVGTGSNQNDINASLVYSYGPWKSFTQNVPGVIRAKLACMEWDFLRPI